MDKHILISLSGHPAQFRLDVDAQHKLEAYLDGAAARLHDDPDKAEILGDLERSLGDKLSTVLGSSDRTLTAADIDAVIDEIGAIETGKPAPEAKPGATSGRRLVRIRQGQGIAGVCTGIAAYSEIPVDWVRLFFLAATTATAGIFALVYAALAFALPIADAPEGRKA